MTNYFWENCLLAEGLQDWPYSLREDLAFLGGEHDTTFPSSFLQKELQRAERKYGRESTEFRLSIFAQVMRIYPTIHLGFRQAAKAVEQTTGEFMSEAELAPKRADLISYFWERIMNLAEEDVTFYGKTLIAAYAFQTLLPLPRANH